jgi:HrpA-like RNA helicase
MVLTLSQVHERSIESDFLLIVLRLLIERRKDLKYIDHLSSFDVI